MIDLSLTEELIMRDIYTDPNTVLKHYTSSMNKEVINTLHDRGLVGKGVVFDKGCGGSSYVALQTRLGQQYYDDNLTSK